jgi:hypothetical protein
MMEKVVKKVIDQNLYAIHFIRPNIKEMKTRYDEFGTPTSAYSQDFIGYVAALVRDVSFEPFQYSHAAFDPKTYTTQFLFKHVNHPETTKALKLRITSSPYQPNVQERLGTLIVQTHTELQTDL